MRKKLLLALGIIIILFAVATLVTALLSKKNASTTKSVADTFVGYVLDGNEKASYNLLTSDAQQNQSESDWSTTVKNLSTFFKGTKPTYVSTTSADKNNIVTYQIQGKDGQYYFTVTLSNAGGSTAVDAFRSDLKV